ncbi:MBL fold metallo-hydrolase [soil metagenome]
MALEAPGADPIVLDLGTGLRFWGETLLSDGSFRGSALVTHLHWDHVQGLPFFTPVDRPGAQFDIYAPSPDRGDLADAFGEFMRPPYFPVRTSDLRGDIRFHQVDDTDMVIGEAKVRVRPVPHVGRTNGYRVELGGSTVAYVSDHQQPQDGGFAIADSVLDLCDGADLLIHDAQFTDAEFAEKSHWGHCTVDYAVEVARRSGVPRLALFHHDPAHSDDMVDRLVERAQARCGWDGPVEVLAAAEGLTISLGG